MLEGNINGVPYIFDEDHTIELTFTGTTIGVGTYNLHIWFPQISMLRCGFDQNNALQISIVKS